MKEKKETKMGEKDSKKFLKIANSIFAPIYPVIAGQIISNTSIKTGSALDVGSGPGHLATALASASDLVVYTLDLSPDMIEICRNRVEETRLSGRVLPTLGDVSDIPFEDGTFDLVVSRGSWFFWDDLSQGLAEVYRVLKPGGQTYIGGGFGNAELKKQIVSAMQKQDEGFESGMKERIGNMSPERVAAALATAKIHDYSIISDETGFWLRMVRT